jgi:hypothetical protein
MMTIQKLQTDKMETVVFVFLSNKNEYIIFNYT